VIQINEEVLREMVDAIVREVDPERVYLFGSYATGKTDEDSDIDLLVVEREPFGPERKRLAELSRVRRALSSFRVPKDILVYSSDEFAHGRNSLNHIIGHCLR